jgi:hypothetical protein
LNISVREPFTTAFSPRGLALRADLAGFGC